MNFETAKMRLAVAIAGEREGAAAEWICDATLSDQNGAAVRPREPCKR